MWNPWPSKEKTARDSEQWWLTRAVCKCVRARTHSLHQHVCVAEPLDFHFHINRLQQQHSSHDPPSSTVLGSRLFFSIISLIFSWFPAKVDYENNILSYWHYTSNITPFCVVSMSLYEEKKKFDHCGSAYMMHTRAGSLSVTPVQRVSDTQSFFSQIILTFCDIISNQDSCQVFYLLSDRDLVLLFSIFVVSSFRPDELIWRFVCWSVTYLDNMSSGEWQWGFN